LREEAFEYLDNNNFKSISRINKKQTNINSKHTRLEDDLSHYLKEDVRVRSRLALQNLSKRFPRELRDIVYGYLIGGHTVTVPATGSSNPPSSVVIGGHII
jgi:hypothetical protein